MQVCDFDKGISLDKKVKKLYLEGEGGPSWKESYEMMAYYYSRHVDFINPEKQKPFLFFVGDEGFKDRILGDMTQKHFGESAVLTGKDAIKELTDKTHKDKLFICLESSLDDTTAANLSLDLDLKTI